MVNERYGNSRKHSQKVSKGHPIRTPSVTSYAKYHFQEYVTLTFKVTLFTSQSLIFVNMKMFLQGLQISPLKTLHVAVLLSTITLALQQ